ncbi:hypothetical protein H072_627 [Dactylellina haptotyla CBS 200.50]|uniref:T6SS Phospholipase effector Tle1-like catalytic domain-containing protein n=1 Tax=Dactylellina haptotyla (strain CBS 200.50) TaxID=1284197 RepID=S8AWN0_DACHA|nr:hypothetical protein H072_627 [Dactylellina haptotyla CBS 200.50]
MPGIPKFTKSPNRKNFPPFPSRDSTLPPDFSMSTLLPLALAHPVKLPASATALPSSPIQLQVVSQQLELLTAALKSGNPIPELVDTLKLANPASTATRELRGNVTTLVNKGFLGGLLNPTSIISSLSNPTAIPEKLAAVTNNLKTGSPIDNITKLLGAGALPTPAPESVSNALSTVTDVLSANNLISNITKSSDPVPSLTPETVSGAISTVTNALKSGDLVPNLSKGAAGLTSISPVPLSDLLVKNDVLFKITPQSLTEALGTVSSALKSGDLISSTDKLPLSDLPLPVPEEVQDALHVITSALHANDLLADATKLPATILPAPLAEIVSNTLETITAALTSGVQPRDAKQLSFASGLPDSLAQVISDTIVKVGTLPLDLAQTITSTLGAISDVLKSSDQLLDATGLPGSALVAPLTSAVAEILDTVAQLLPPAPEVISEIIDSVAAAVKARDLTSTLPTSSIPPDNPVTNALNPTATTSGIEVPDADNSTNTNPQPDGHRGKRVIICCDGTWQDSDQGDAGFPTNVTRFARALKSVSDDGVAQIIYYQSGVGSSYASKFGRLIAGGTGLGLSEHVREAFVFISNNYHVQDEIYILGFSRGAFTARSIAGLIGRIGVLTRRGMESFGKIYEDYINFKLKDEAYIIKQSWERIKDVKIKAIGCWDTVGALGIPASPVIEKCKCNDKYKFHDTDLTQSTENAFHALALDEHRMPFTPTLWRLPAPGASERHADIPNLKQVWFPGVHTNIGGGYADQEIADLTLVWMIDQFLPFLGFDLDYVKSLRNPDDINNWASGKVYNSFTGVMKAASSKVRTPGGYFRSPPKSPLKRAITFGAGVFGQPGVKSVTMEEIHPSVRGRCIASDGLWCSRALFGWACDKEIIQGATGLVEKWVWRNRETGTMIPESDLGSQEKLLAGTEVLSKLASSLEVPLRSRKGPNMDQGAVRSKWDEQPE